MPDQAFVLTDGAASVMADLRLQLFSRAEADAACCIVAVLTMISKPVRVRLQRSACHQEEQLYVHINLAYAAWECRRRSTELGVAADAL